jgi:large subunit ribosomal protein L22
MVTASLKNYRQSARKVRLVVDEIRGKKALDAIVQLSFTPKRSSEPLQKLIKSAIANAEHNHSLKAEDLVISEIRVNEGFSMKRYIPQARGMAHPIRKRTSHIEIQLSDNSPAKKEVKKEDAVKKEATATNTTNK